MSSSSSSSSSGVSAIGLLGVLFVGLKLTGFIDWSWWWVTLPFWGGLALFLVIGLIWLVVVVIRSLIKRHKYNKRMRELGMEDAKRVTGSSFQDRLKNALRRQRIKNLLNNK